MKSRQELELRAGIHSLLERGSCGKKMKWMIWDASGCRVNNHSLPNTGKRRSEKLNAQIAASKYLGLRLFSRERRQLFNLLIDSVDMHSQYPPAHAFRTWSRTKSVASVCHSPGCPHPRRPSQDQSGNCDLSQPPAWLFVSS